MLGDHLSVAAKDVEDEGFTLCGEHRSLHKNERNTVNMPELIRHARKFMHFHAILCMKPGSEGV
jgi:hypothetical protein